MFTKSRKFARPQTSWRPTKSFWITAVIVLLVMASSGFGNGLAVLGVVGLLTGVYALIFKRKSWAGITGRKPAAMVVAGGFAVALIGSAIAGPTTPPTDQPVKADVVSAETTPASEPTDPEEADPALAPCATAGDIKVFKDREFVCSVNANGDLVWLDEASVKAIADKKAAGQEAIDEAKAEQAALKKAAAEKAATEKAAADQAAADKVAADKAAAERAAAQKAADKAAAEKAAADQAAADEAAAAAQQAEQQAPPAVTGYVHPGSFCSGDGAPGVSKTGKAMVCTTASDGRLRWRSA